MRVFAAKAEPIPKSSHRPDGRRRPGAVRWPRDSLAETNSNLGVTITNRDNQLALGRETVYEILVANTGNGDFPRPTSACEVLFPPELDATCALAQGPRQDEVHARSAPVGAV